MDRTPVGTKKNASVAILAVLVAATFLAGCLSDYTARPGTGNGNSSGGGDGRVPQDVPYGSQVLDDGHVLHGAWLGAWPSDENDVISSFESKTGTRLDVVDLYMDWTTPFRNASYAVEEIAKHGSVALLTWQPNGLTTPQIADGTGNISVGGRTLAINAYLNEFASQACESVRDTQTPILVRMMHEPNGEWHSWAIGYRADDGGYPNTDTTYKDAWAKIRGAFDEYCEAGQDIRFIYAVNQVSFGRNTTFMGPYPGDGMVEYVGIDGYNWGEHASWGWESFHKLFSQPYCAVSTASTRPVWITEFTSTERGGDKADWVARGLGDVANGRYPRVEGLVWLNEPRFEQSAGQQMDWPVDSSPAALAAYSDAIGTMQASRTGGGAGATAGAAIQC
jgi:endoglucanase